MHSAVRCRCGLNLVRMGEALMSWMDGGGKLLVDFPALPSHWVGPVAGLRLISFRCPRVHYCMSTA